MEKALSSLLLLMALVVLMLFFENKLFAQSNRNAVLGATSGSSPVDGKTMDWSVGGTAVTATATLPNGQLLTQGFLQPSDIIIQLLLLFDPLAKKTYEDVDFTLFAQASDGSPIEYESTNPAVAIIVNGNTVKIVGAGSANIKATIKGTTISKNQPLVVDKATQMITFEMVSVLYRGESGYTLNASSNKGLPITFHNGNSYVVRLSGKVITPVELGKATITAVQSGNNNYKPAEVAQEVTVLSRDGDQISIPLAITPNGDGINDVLVIKGVEFFPENSIVIVNRNGTKVFEAKGYDNSQVIFQGKESSQNSFSGRFRSDFVPAGTYFYSFRYKDGEVYKRKTGYFIIKYN